MEKKPFILAVDDEPSILRVLERALVPAGFDLVTTNDSYMALELLEQKTPDLVLLDIMMPGLNGVEILERIRKRMNIPIIMLTAKCDIPTTRDCLNLGADDFIPKPFSVVVLLARINAKLRRAPPVPTRPASFPAALPVLPMQPQYAPVQQTIPRL